MFRAAAGAVRRQRGRGGAAHALARESERDREGLGFAWRAHLGDICADPRVALFGDVLAREARAAAHIEQELPLAVLGQREQLDGARRELGLDLNVARCVGVFGGGLLVVHDRRRAVELGTRHGARSPPPRPCRRRVRRVARGRGRATSGAQRAAGGSWRLPYGPNAFRPSSTPAVSRRRSRNPLSLWKHQIRPREP